MDSLWISQTQGVWHVEREILDVVRLGRLPVLAGSMHQGRTPRDA